MIRAGILLALAFGLAEGAGAQTLDTASQRLDLAGYSPAACVIAQPTASAPVNASYSPTGTASGQITIGQLVDSQTATALASSIRLDLPVTCNSSHQVLVRSSNGALLRAGAAAAGTTSGGFAQSLGYRLGIDWNGDSVSMDSAQQTAGIAVPSPAKGDLTLRFSTAAGGGPLVAGQYTDSIIVELVPAN